MSLAARSGHLVLSPQFEWIATDPALITLASATVLEILIYYIPWLDNFMDTIATPVAVAAGTVASASIIKDMSPFLQWTLALIAGGGTAGVVQAGTVLVRGMSTATSGGSGNFLVSTGEACGAVFTSILAVLFPVAAVAVVGTAVIIVAPKLIRKSQKSQSTLDTEPVET